MNIACHSESPASEDRHSLCSAACLWPRPPRMRFWRSWLSRAPQASVMIIGSDELITISIRSPMATPSSARDLRRKPPDRIRAPITPTVERSSGPSSPEECRNSSPDRQASCFDVTMAETVVAAILRDHRTRMGDLKGKRSKGSKWGGDQSPAIGGRMSPPTIRPRRSQSSSASVGAIGPDFSPNTACFDLDYNENYCNLITDRFRFGCLIC
jgi:hypothetical protein